MAIDKKSPLLKGALAKSALLVAALAAAAIFFTLDAGRADDVNVKIDNFTFDPQVLTVKVGTTVTWKNVDDIPHTVASKTPKLFKSKALDTDDSYSFTFKEAGTFDYFCSLHPHMTATIKVEGPVGEAPPAAKTAAN
jgi:plastocyanin